MITSTFIRGDEDLTEPFAIRREVFIEEQSCPEDEEYDEFDRQAMHLMIYVDEQPAACGRVWHDGKSYRIGRLAVRPMYRGQKLGDLAVRLMLFKATNMGAEQIDISAQTYIMPLYKKFGFVQHGKEYMEAGIPHKRMTVKTDDIVYPSDCCKA